MIETESQARFRLSPGALVPLPAARLPEVRDLHRARSVLDPVVVRTPVHRSPWLSRRLQRPVWLKLEHLQHTGSFKFRGGFCALSGVPAGKVVVAASAGNHSLALAEVSRRTGHRLVLCLPRTASPIKRERLSGYDVTVLDHGTTLDEATGLARALAAREGWEFISPYNDRRVVAGNATIGYEVIEQIPAIEGVVLPVGGGGLAAGVGLALADQQRKARIYGCQPEAFASLAKSVLAGSPVREVYRPSLADGLMVNVDPEAVTLDWARAHLGPLIRLTEEQIAAGVLALMHHESMLVEPSAAVGIGAAVAGCLQQIPGEGPIVILLTGANITLATLGRLLAFPFEDDALVRALELRHPTAAEETIFLSPPPPVSGSPAPPAVDGPGSTPLRLRRRLDETERGLEDLMAVLDDEGIAPAGSERGFLDDLAALTRRLVLDLPSGEPAGHREERAFRLAHRAVAFLDQSMAWQSESVQQSQVAPFGHVGAQRSSRANYARYGSDLVGDLERAYQDALGFAGHTSSVLLTSSGMAAYHLLESYLLRHVWDAGDVVVCQPGIYFETLEQVERLRSLRVHCAGGNDAAHILEAVERHRPSTVFLDPLTNTAELRLNSLRGLLGGLDTASRGLLHVVVDGTMLSGAVDPFPLVQDSERVRLLYYESGSKYLQMGLDLALLGIVACPPALRPLVERQRRNTGTMLYETSAAMLPVQIRGEYLSRLQRMTRNAILIARGLEREDGIPGSPRIRPVFPGCRSHPDHASAGEYAHLGGVMTLQLEPVGFNNRWVLEAYIEQAIHAAQQRGVPLCRGVSFGFSTPRISAAWSVAETSPPFLRLAVGTQEEEATLRLVQVLRGAFTRLVASLNGDRLPGTEEATW